MQLKTYFAAAELAELKLNNVPATRDGVRMLAERASWPFIEQRGRGGLRREYQPPQSVMAQIRDRAARQLLNEAKQLPVPDSLKTTPPIRDYNGTQLELVLTEKQRLRADARKGVLLAIERLMQGCNLSKEQAIAGLLVEAGRDPAGQAARMLKLAEDERGRKGEGALPSVRTIKRWFAQDKVGQLAPKQTQVDLSVPPWAPAFLAVWQTPQKPSMAAAYRLFTQSWQAGAVPSIDQVRRFVDKLGKVSREVGRRGSRDIKNIKPYVIRTFEGLQAGDVYSADGHCFDAEIRHPLTSKPFRPEITSIIDIATRRLVGFSVDLAESGLAVVDALRYSAVNAAVCATFYVDNGSGYDNAMLKDEATGLLARLGITISHSLPYNSQARGVIERLHQSVWVAAARELPTYIGKDMDRQAGQAMHKITRKALTQGGVQPMMAWADFMAFCHRKVAEYNARPHKSLGGRTPDQVWAEQAAKAELHRLSAADAEHLFRPMVTRKVSRGMVQLFNNKYFSAALEEYHGEFVWVAYDVHDAEWVWVYDRNKRLLSKAQWGANEAAYFPQPVTEQNRIKREEARLARVEAKADDIRDGLAAPMMGQLAAPELDFTQQLVRDGLRNVIDVEPVQQEIASVDTSSVRALSDVPRPLFQRMADRYRWLMAHQTAWTEADRDWLKDYVQSDDYEQRVDLFEVECIAWQGNALLEIAV